MSKDTCIKEDTIIVFRLVLAFTIFKKGGKYRMDQLIMKIIKLLIIISVMVGGKQAMAEGGTTHRYYDVFGLLLVQSQPSSPFLKQKIKSE